jgi:molecular chaperone DnaK
VERCAVGEGETILGIDLGTTTSCIAAVIDGQVRVLADDEGRRVIPSVVSFTPDRELVGFAARERLITDPENTIYSFKRLLGRQFSDPRTKAAIAGFPYRVAEGPGGAAVIVARGQTYGVAEIAARVLVHLKTIAEARLGHPVRQVVVAVPASFDDMQRTAIGVAGKISGLDVVRVINEPTAAALAFGYDRKEPRLIGVYDFGGGTFDFTLLRFEDQHIRVLAVAGDSMLGGDDLDLAIAFAAAETFRVETGRNLWRDVAEWQRLLFACERAKRRLSVEPRTEVRLRAVARTPSGVKDLVYVLDRRKFQQICGENIDKTFRCCSEALAQAGVDPTDVETVILVGGTTFVRIVRSRVGAYFQTRPDITVDPTEAVALGAAIHGASLGGHQVEAPTSRRLLEVTNKAIALSCARSVSVILARNEPLPASDTRSYVTTREGQTEMRFKVFQGDAGPEESWTLIGEAVIDGLPPEPAGRIVVDVSVMVDEQNRVSVRIFEGTTKREVITRLGHDETYLSDGEIDALLVEYLHE